MSTVTWREELLSKLRKRDELWGDIVSCTLSAEELDQPFATGYGAVEGLPFTVWTHHSVYFPVCYDGHEWVGAVARNPDRQATNHQGGG